MYCVEEIEKKIREESLNKKISETKQISIQA